MGQYYKIVNLDKKQYLNPHVCGDGAKLLEFGMSSVGMMSALAILLADGNNRGGGDLRSDKPIIGSWAGDRIVITGDCADAGRFCPEGFEFAPLYDVADDEENPEWKDVSLSAMAALCDDPFIKREIEERAESMQWDSSYKRILEEASK